ncbi:MAG: alpha-amylase family glycosyl hydrolase [Bacteroides sp.]|nr:alpha-amylase family glycosyl hydrolase [Bacteroides sp.]MCM1096387.1 alpha-amylase family glycosyl hydrolase [Terasakiella sp.]
MKFTPLLMLAAVAMPAAAQAPTEDESILHAWSWSLDTIAANMKDIADAGYAFVQTSPVQRCYVGDGGGMALYSQPGDSVMGKWYYYYQPTDWKIGNYMLGDRDDFKAMCDSAYKYGVRVLVDVLPNHTAVDHTAVLPDLDAAVGGHENLFHAAGFTPITDYNDRLQCTTGEMGGLPDVNTENPDFQYYYLQYVNDLINLGARGFRYDTAKHIGLPDEPRDPRSPRNNFWPIFTGREGVKGLSLLMPDSLYIYGEVLQDRNVNEVGYAEYIDQTASAYGHALREALRKGAAPERLLTDWEHPVSPDRLVTWVESHDTYCNQHESADMTDEQMRAGYVFLTARQHGRPLFFSRPMGSTRENYWGNNRIGARGNDEFKHPEVAAANRFRRAMHGRAERLVTAADGRVVEICRGADGAALVNFSDRDLKVKMATDLPDGTYRDAVSGRDFKVAKGELSGRLAPLGTYILYR